MNEALTSACRHCGARLQVDSLLFHMMTRDGRLILTCRCSEGAVDVTDAVVWARAALAPRAAAKEKNDAD